MTDVIKNLQITTWYKAVVAVMGPAFLIALVAQRDGLAMLFAGGFLFGVGGWINHPKKEIEIRPMAGQWAKVTDVPRRANWFGTLLQLIGIALMAYGTYLALGFPKPAVLDLLV